MCADQPATRAQPNIAGYIGGGILAIVAGEPLQQRDRVAVGGAVLQADDREPANGLVVVGGREPVQRRAHRVDSPGGVAREQLQRDQRRPTAGRALVVEPAREQLDLLAEAELADRAVGHRSLAVVGAAGAALDLVLPLPPQIRQPPFVTRLREGLGLCSCLLERQDGAPVSERGAGPT